MHINPVGKPTIASLESLNERIECIKDEICRVVHYLPTATLVCKHIDALWLDIQETFIGVAEDVE